jgi:hypothetical protein
MPAVFVGWAPPSILICLASTADDGGRCPPYENSADYTTAYRNAVLAYDAANEIGLGIAIAKPTGGPGGR